MPRTPSPEQRARTREVLDLLAARYPALFPALGPGVRLAPLAVGVAKDLAAALEGEVSARELKPALLAWCLGGRYLRALTRPGAVRTNLAGEVVGPVTPEQAELARQMLDRLEARKAKLPQACADPETAAP